MAGLVIERDVLIEAPADVVWRTITEPDQMRLWFADRVELMIEPGAHGYMQFGDQGGPVVVEIVDPPTRFSFRWNHPRGEEPVAGNSMLVEFTLTPEGDERTRLRVVESGHELRTWPEPEKQSASTRPPGPWPSSPRSGTGGSARSSGSPKPRTRKTRTETVMKDESANLGGSAAGAGSAPGLPGAVDRATFQAELDGLRVREKAHTREGDAIAAARRRLPMVEVDASLTLTGPQGTVTLLEAFEGRRQLIAYYFMWWAGHPAAEQCEGCTWVTAQVGELSYLHSRDITYAVFCQGPFDESARYRDFMGWDIP